MYHGRVAYLICSGNQQHRSCAPSVYYLGSIFNALEGIIWWTLFEPLCIHDCLLFTFHAWLNGPACGKIMNTYRKPKKSIYYLALRGPSMTNHCTLYKTSFIRNCCKLSFTCTEREIHNAQNTHWLITNCAFDLSRSSSRSSVRMDLFSASGVTISIFYCKYLRTKW